MPQKLGEFSRSKQAGKFQANRRPVFAQFDEPFRRVRMDTSAKQPTLWWDQWGGLFLDEALTQPAGTLGDRRAPAVR